MVAEDLSPYDSLEYVSVWLSEDVHVPPEKTMRVLFDRRSFNRVVHLLCLP